MNEYSLERVTPQHYSLLKELYWDSFHSKMDIAEIQWRFDTAALGCEHIGFIAIHSVTGKAAAYYGVFPQQLSFHDHTILAAQSGDTMTHRQHRLKGLFIQLAKLTYAECAEKSISLIFGFPNANSFSGFINKLGWKQIDSIQRLDLKLKFKTFPFPKISKGTGFLKKLYLSYARLVLRKKLTASPSSFTNNYPCDYAKVFRDKNYIAYKKSADKFFIQIAGQVLWIKLTDVLWIGDLNQYPSIDTLFIRKIKRLAFLLGYNTISFNINESVSLPVFPGSFKKYSTEPSCVLFLDDTIRPANILFTGADFDTW